MCAQYAIGSDVFVGAGSWLQVLDEPGGDHVALEIGDGTSIAGGCVLSAASSVRLGRRVLIARNVYISDHIHAYDDTTTAVLDQGISRVEAVEIGDGAWLGENVIVCPGVRIGRGAVVGGNAVVIDDVPDFALAVGVPARVVRSFAPAGAEPRRMRRALVLAYHFPPIGGAGAQRPLKFVRALPDYGYEPIVITGPGPTSVAGHPRTPLARRRPRPCEVRRVAEPEPLPSGGSRAGGGARPRPGGPWASVARRAAALARDGRHRPVLAWMQPYESGRSPPAWRRSCASPRSPTSAIRGRSTRCSCT